MPAEIRKTLLHVENTLIEGDKAAERPLTLIAAMAVIRNPWAGQGFVEDLAPAIRDCAPGLGELLTKMIIDAAGGGDKVEGYGKAAIVGLNGEVEHASALIHTLHFGNHYRNAVGAKSYLSFCNTRGPANAPLLIPLMALGIGLCLLGWIALHWPEFYRDFPNTWDSAVRQLRS